MTYDEIICGALEFLGIPVAELVYRGDLEQYATYNLIAERGADYADDACELLAAEYHLHFYGRGNPQPVKRAVRQALSARDDFYVLSSQVLYDDAEQDYYHVVFDVDILNTADDELAGEEGENENAV